MSWPTVHRPTALLIYGVPSNAMRTVPARSIPAIDRPGDIRKMYTDGLRQLATPDSNIAIPRRAAAMRAVRTAMRFHPVIGRALDILDLLEYFAKQPAAAVPAHWDMTGWTNVENCRAPTMGPFRSANAGCVGNKFINQNLLPPWGVNVTACQFLNNPTFSSPAWIGLNAQRWTRAVGSMNAPAFVPATQAQAPQAAFMPDPFKEPLPAWDRQPRVSRAVGENPETQQDSARGYGREAQASPQPRVGTFPSESWAWEVQPSPRPRPSHHIPYRPQSRPETRVIEDPAPEKNAVFKPDDIYISARPRARTREKKRIANIPGASIIGRVIGFATETLDLINALYKAIPKELRPGRRPDQWGRIQAIIKHWRRIPIEDAIAEIFWNQLEDLAYGSLGRLGAKAVQSAARHGYYERPVGLTTGSWDTDPGAWLYKGLPRDLAQPSPLDAFRAYVERTLNIQ